MITWALAHPHDVAAATVEHALLVLVSVAIALGLALGIGIIIRRRPRAYAVVMGATAILYTIPSLALFALLIPLVGLGRTPAVIGLVAYALLILTRNVATGLREVPADVLEVAAGMGLDPRQRLFQIELPLAMPTIVAGVRVAVVTVIAIAAVAAYINAGGLGTLIFSGLNQNFPAKIAVGAALASLMAVGADVGLARLERRLRASRSG